MRFLVLSFSSFLISCSTTFKNQNPTGKVFPQIEGKALSGQKYKMPEDFKKEKVILLIGYKQNSQFDIDRWLLGLDFKKVKTNVFEIPAVVGFIPSLISGKIDEGMKSGIPEGLWKAVVTVYDDAEIVAKFTGNEDPLNARVLVLDENAKVIYFHDKGFSVPDLNQLVEKL